MNKKIIKRIGVLSATAVVTCATVLGATGCDDDGKRTYDNAKDTLVFSSQDFDKVFNPFYSTSAMDANAVGMTQIGMIGNDEKGNPVWGDDEAVVTKEFYTRTLGDPKTDQTTEYYFVLKNNVKFSNGTYLTMKDVLFNMYVYLDPAYSGSSTMYSTDIVGLKEYRTQSADEKEQDKFEEQFIYKASERIMNLDMAIAAVKDAHPNQIAMTSEQMISYLEKYANDNNSDAYEYIVSDYKKAEELFRKELKQDFNDSKDSYEDTKFTNENGDTITPFTTDVEVFLYNEGYITWKKKENNGAGALESKLENDVSVFKKWTEEQAIAKIVEDMIPSKMDEVINYWGTATDLAGEIAGAAKEEYFKTHTREYKNIKGIEFINRTQPVTIVTDTATGATKEIGVPVYNEDKTQVVSGNEVLKVTINKVDPKAIWNFSFGVAPMYYYSNEEQIKAFDYEEHFGVEYGSQSFMDKTIKNADKIGVPVGAGPYVAASESDRTEGITGGDFLANNVMYFVSNPHYLMGEPKIKHVRYQVVNTNQLVNTLQTGRIDFAEPNAKTEVINELKGLSKKGIGYTSIQTAGYGYIGINASKVPSIYVRRAIMHCIDTSLSVEYYKGTADPIFRSMSRSSWAYPQNALSYYPYIGDPIPDDLSKVGEDYREFVTDKRFESGYTMKEEEQVEFIKYLVEEKAGYGIDGNGIYANNHGRGSTKLKYTFTIAGQENDHPAFMAMYLAGQFLTDKVGGFQIVTKADNNALTKLSTGALAVWAAAWGSTIDPDMYQVYHMDSKATSVQNWGYPAILNNAGGRYDTEKAIVEELSTLIEEGRQFEDHKTRAIKYAEALDLVMELAVELPTYQRDDLFAYNAFKIDVNTFTPADKRSAFKGLTSEIYNLSFVTEIK